MNKFLLFQRKLMAWGNPDKLEELNDYGKEMTWWESFGWEKKENENR